MFQAQILSQLQNLQFKHNLWIFPHLFVFCYVGVHLLSFVPVKFVLLLVIVSCQEIVVSVIVGNVVRIYWDGNDKLKCITNLFVLLNIYL